MAVQFFDLKRTGFVLWRPLNRDRPPALVIGEFQAGNPPALVNRQRFDLAALPSHPDVFTISANRCGLADGHVYHYWFEVTDSSPDRDGRRIPCTDPAAFTVDWRLQADPLPGPYNDDDRDPAAVVLFRNGELIPCDADGTVPARAPSLAQPKAPRNNRLVIYELPTSWASTDPQGDPQIGVGTFRDVRALVDAAAPAANFSGIPALSPGRSHLEELGINALELLPIADSFVDREWGYATSNYFAPDYDLGFPKGHTSPTASGDLVNLVTACHDRGIRFFIDVVMAFATHGPMENVNFDEYHIDPQRSPNDPDAGQSGGQGTRDGFGGRLWRYGLRAEAFDPLSGGRGELNPARQLLKAHIVRWMTDFAIDGIRMDSINNIANWDFVQEFKDLARETWIASGGSADTFLVVGEELSVPLELLRQARLDGLWNERFKRGVRNVILGRNDDGEPSFEWSVRKLIDCRLTGFTDGAQAVNYLGSHDVEGFRNERLFNFLLNNGVARTEERIKLAFACLLTSVGVPMIFAGDEFADQHDLSVGNPAKQRDAVNYERVDEPFRRRVFDFVARLVKFRTTSDALSVNETDFIHVDFTAGKRVLVWRRGRPGVDDPVVVVANFSDFATDTSAPSAEYVVPNWPGTPAGKRWRDVSQARDVPDEWAGREPIFPWEAKVYATVDR
jgi:pullulanase